jgi:hypothetical protein
MRSWKNKKNHPPEPATLIALFTLFKSWRDLNKKRPPGLYNLAALGGVYGAWRGGRERARATRIITRLF